MIEDGKPVHLDAEYKEGECVWEYDVMGLVSVSRWVSSHFTDSYSYCYCSDCCCLSCCCCYFNRCCTKDSIKYSQAPR